MNLHRSITPATRLSIALVFVTTTVLFAAAALGFLPAHEKPLATSRLRLSEALSLQLSISAQHGDAETIAAVARTMLDANPDLRSIALRTDDEGLVLATRDHEVLWADQPSDPIVPTHVELPAYRDGGRWGTAELCFVPAREAGLFGGRSGLMIFVALLGFVLYRLYLRRVLKYLDPSNVIPERVQAMLDTMAEGVLVLDRRERIILANRAFVSASGKTLEELQGCRASDIPWEGEPSSNPQFVYPWTEAAAGEPSRGVELHLKGDDDEPRVLMVNCTPILGADGNCRGALATFDDVTTIEEKNARLERMVMELETVRKKVQKQNDELQILATHDTLTGCLNRRAIFERLDAEWSGAHRHGHALACMMIDIDHFKSINDNHGHAMGDRVLAHVAKILRARARKADIVGRYGGEEFCLLLPDTQSRQAQALAESLRQALIDTPISGIQVTASFGISSLEFGARDPHGLIDQADQALYGAKNAGRNRAVRWDEMDEVPVLENVAPEHRVEPALDGDVPIPFHAVLALMSALGHRDPGTAAHSRRVAELCTVAADGLMTAGDSFVLEVAAMLHDIGKIGVPDAILLKPGPLTDEEWEVMQAHDQMGIEIINSAFHSQELTNIVRNHHAHFGGDARAPGLPTGHEIPIRRILTIADAYDAMVSDRVYRKGRSAEEAFTELRRCVGTQFDTDLVERFIEAVSARDAGRAPEPVADSTEVMLELGLAVERLMAALEANDLKCVVAMADRLQGVAVSCQHPEIAEQAARLVRSTESDNELVDVLEATAGLVSLCEKLREGVIDDKTGHRRVA